MSCLLYRLIALFIVSQLSSLSSRMVYTLAPIRRSLVMLTHYLDDHQLSRNVYFECAIHLLFPSNAFRKRIGGCKSSRSRAQNGNSSSRSRHIASDLNRRYMSELVCPNFYCEVLDLSCFYPKCFFGRTAEMKSPMQPRCTHGLAFTRLSTRH